SLRALGIDVHYGEWNVLNKLLHLHEFDIIFFEYYQFAIPYLDEIRYLQPRARLVIDTIDISYERLLSKARISGKPEDFNRARKEKAAELSAYRKCDAVIAVSD